MSNSSKKSFMDKCIEGIALVDDIDDYIDEYHDSNSELEIFDYLGMTRREYRLWVRDHDYLNLILAARIQNVSIETFLSTSNDMKMAARNLNSDDYDNLITWLKSIEN